MTAGNRASLAASGQQRSRHTHDRAVNALRRLDATGQNVTFTNVAQAAGISRSWLYRQPDLRSEIDRLRSTSGGGERRVPSAQRASDDSLRRRLEATLDEIRRLKTENEQLRERVAQQFGQQRADWPT
jgi:hypothetical protein